MPETPLVSIIIPFYNRIPLVCRAIDSVVRQTYNNYEIILIDDGSTDDVSPVFEKIKTITSALLLKQNNRGPSSARNKGIENSNGEYIAFLDSDDTWSTEKLSLQVEFMRNNNYLFSHTSYFREDEKLKNNSIIRSGLSNYKYPFIAFHCMIATPTVIVYRSLLSSHNKFDESILVGEDTVLWIEISKKTTLYGLDDVLSTVYVDDNNTASNSELKINAFKSINSALISSPILKLAHNFYINVRTFFRIL